MVLVSPVRRRLAGLCAESPVVVVVVFVFAAVLVLAGHSPQDVIAFLSSLGLVATTIADRLGRNTSTPPNVVLR
ncbi:hypothetical protein [Amycolatopsis rifamycinica]|uniref:hypothetical protein n=1 Tax=Amycolatopsis rifamycinica TaxID=287986 RepID=UPI0005C1447F|nr:hypothetical protein [Amycolatopsis rifamycinica]